MSLSSPDSEILEGMADSQSSDYQSATLINTNDIDFSAPAFVGLGLSSALSIVSIGIGAVIYMIKRNQ